MQKVTKWGVKGRGQGQFHYPTGIAISNDGLVYVADNLNHRVQCFTSDGNFLQTWGVYGSGVGEFNHPEGLALGKRQGRIEAALYEVPELSVFPPGLLPLCASYFGEERIYVVDAGNNRIQSFDIDASTTFICAWGTYGEGQGEFRGPRGCVVDDKDRVYVSDSSNHRIQVFEANGSFIRTWGRQGVMDGEFIDPQGVFVSSDGLIYVADCITDRVQCFYEDGTLAYKIECNIFKQVGTPYGLLISEDKKLYVTDYDREAILVFLINETGAIIRKWKYKCLNALFSPTGIAKRRNSNTHVVYISEMFNHRIICLDLNISLDKQSL